VRYPREMRDSLEKLRSAAHRHRPKGRAGAGRRGRHRISDGPPMLRSENARLSGWVYVDMRGRDLRSACRTCSARWREGEAAAGYSVSWSGQFEFLERATAKLKVVVPFTLLIIFVLLYLTFKQRSTKRC
jgi:Cu(I)/Ag(I) efflux system membrane protein CusA/SilA